MSSKAAPAVLMMLPGGKEPPHRVEDQQVEIRPGHLMIREEPEKHQRGSRQPTQQQPEPNQPHRR